MDRKDIASIFIEIANKYNAWAFGRYIRDSIAGVEFTTLDLSVDPNIALIYMLADAKMEANDLAYARIFENEENMYYQRNLYGATYKIYSTKASGIFVKVVFVGRDERTGSQYYNSNNPTAPNDVDINCLTQLNQGIIHLAKVWENRGIQINDVRQRIIERKYMTTEGIPNNRIIEIEKLGYTNVSSPVKSKEICPTCNGTKSIDCVIYKRACMDCYDGPYVGFLA